MASKRPVEEPKHVNIPELFGRLGAPLFRTDSTGALHPDGTVYLLCDKRDFKDGKVVIYRQPETRAMTAGESERKMHVMRIRAGHPCRLVTLSGELFGAGGLTETGSDASLAVGDKLPD